MGDDLGLSVHDATKEEEDNEDDNDPAVQQQKQLEEIAEATAVDIYDPVLLVSLSYINLY